MKKLLSKGFFILLLSLFFILFFANQTQSANKVIVPDLEDTYKNYFEKRKSAMYYIENLQPSTDFLFYAKKFSKKDFMEKKNEYRTKGGADAYVFDLISKQEEFYTSTIPTKITETVNAFLELQNFKKNYTLYSAKEALNAYNLSLEYIEGMLLLSPENTYYLDLKAKNTTGKKALENYVATGEYEKKLSERTAEQVNTVKIAETKMQDIYAEWAVNEKILYSDLGKTAAVSITSKQWKIIKDDAGTPMHKYVDVEATVKGTNGKCYKVTGTVTKPFEKEATYGKPIFNYQYKEEMNCEFVVEKK